MRRVAVRVRLGLVARPEIARGIRQRDEALRPIQSAVSHPDRGLDRLSIQSSASAESVVSSGNPARWYMSA